MLRVNTWIALAIVVVAQTGVLATMVTERLLHLRHGKEIILKTVPVDPRSLFRGDYVILNYAISQVPRTAGETVRTGDQRFVTLAQVEGEWQVAAVGTSYPQTLAPDQIVLQGKIVNTWPGDTSPTIDLRYGIESYFIPEGTGRALEDKVRSGDIRVVAAVDGEGRAAIKGLVLDGNVRYDEPLF